MREAPDMSRRRPVRFGSEVSARAAGKHSARTPPYAGGSTSFASTLLVRQTSSDDINLELYSPQLSKTPVMQALKVTDGGLPRTVLEPSRHLF